MIILREDLIDNIKKDINNIKNINQNISQLQDIFFTKIKSNPNYINTSEYYLKLINNIYFEFLETFPTNIQKFNIKSLVESFKTETQNQVNVDADSLDFNHNRNYTLIRVVLIELVRYIKEKRGIENILVQFRNYPNLLIIINCLGVDLLDYYKNSIEFKLIINFLTELIKTSSGRLIINEEYTDKIAIKTNTLI